MLFFLVLFSFFPSQDVTYSEAVVLLPPHHSLAFSNRHYHTDLHDLPTRISANAHRTALRSRWPDLSSCLGACLASKRASKVRHAQPCGCDCPRRCLSVMKEVMSSLACHRLPSFSVPLASSFLASPRAVLSAPILSLPIP
eukprot:2035989-Rhodomonas_salina.4